MPRPSRETEILDAALAALAEHGYDATRVKHIALGAGVSDAALYRHYPSKEAVARALFSTRMRRSAEALTAIATNRDISVRQRVRQLTAPAASRRAPPTPTPTPSSSATSTASSPRCRPTSPIRSASSTA